MSEENVELVRLAYEVAFAQRSVEGVRDRVPPDFRFHTRPEWPGRAMYLRDEMTQFWADLDETFAEFEFTPTSYETFGDHVLVSIHQSAVMRGSNDRVDSNVCHLWLIKDGTPKEGRAFSDRAQALAAAGVRE